MEVLGLKQVHAEKENPKSCDPVAGKSRSVAIDQSKPRNWRRDNENENTAGNR